MSKSPMDRIDRRENGIACPHDHSLMAQTKTRDAILDTCGKCGGQYFDSGEMFAAFGIKADPSFWDRPETGGTVTDGKIHCPRCETFMLVQDVKYHDKHVEIDRCGKCGGIWLDKGEVQTIMAIGEKLQPVLDAERAKAKEELDKMGEVDFSSPGLIAQFLSMFKKKGAS
jgi:Zn-finger nucleic acid-binding protein